MGWLLKHRKKDDKYRLWTTISDGWLTDWLTIDEMRAYLIEREIFDAKVKAIERYMMFPYPFSNMKHRRVYEMTENFYEWHLKILSLKSPEYEEAIEQKFQEICKKYEIVF